MILISSGLISRHGLIDVRGAMHTVQQIDVERRCT
jgi:hypothetical protein